MSFVGPSLPPPDEVHELDVGLPLRLPLRRYGKRAERRPPVLLLHGGNTSGTTFTSPQRGLARHLRNDGFDVWVLEWRSSPEIIRKLPTELIGGSVWEECKVFTLDNAVEKDVPAALGRIRQNIDGALEISVLGHCLGSAVVSMAAARGYLEGTPRVSHIVLSTLGLFVESPWNGWIKAEDFILERVLHNDQRHRSIDPSKEGEWPDDFKNIYKHWPASWLPSGRKGSASEQSLLDRLSFMFGQPYSIDRLDESLRGPAMAEHFGPMHLGLYLHISQMVRRGFAGRFNDPDVIDRPRIERQRRAVFPRKDLAPKHFLDKQVTLIAAGENRLWHRDSIDLMYDWLRSIERRGTPRAVKHVIPGYGLQELMWGVDASRDVYPLVSAGFSSVHGRAAKATALTAGGAASPSAISEPVSGT
jgi:cholesterol oxidase